MFLSFAISTPGIREVGWIGRLAVVFPERLEIKPYEQADECEDLNVHYGVQEVAHDSIGHKREGAETVGKCAGQVLSGSLHDAAQEVNSLFLLVKESKDVRNYSRPSKHSTVDVSNFLNGLFKKSVFTTCLFDQYLRRSHVPLSDIPLNHGIIRSYNRTCLSITALEDTKIRKFIGDSNEELVRFLKSDKVCRRGYCESLAPIRLRFKIIQDDFPVAQRYTQSKCTTTTNI